VKDNLEFKSAQRVLVTGNTLENSWPSGQRGFSVVLTPRTSQSGNIAVVDDITIESNILTGVAEGINTLEYDDLCGAQFGTPNCTNPGEERRVWINNNLLLLSPNLDTYQHSGIQINVSLTDFIFQHNTMLMSDLSTLWNSIYFDANQTGCPPLTGFTQNLWILDNSMTRQPAGDCYSPSTSGIPMLTTNMSQPLSPSLAQRFYGNVMSAPNGDKVQSWPGSSNYVTTTPFTYANQTNGDYELIVPDWITSTDGNVSGIDWSALQQAMNP
jgi:hypothetical protein